MAGRRVRHTADADTLQRVYDPAPFAVCQEADLGHDPHTGHGLELSLGQAGEKAPHARHAGQGAELKGA